MSTSSTKSHVGIGVTLCPVCGAEHDEVVLLDKRLKNSLNPKQIMGWGMCPEHQKLKDDGYIALVETVNEPITINEADRTGQIAHVRSSVWPDLFNSPIPERAMCFVQVGVLFQLAERTAT